MNLEGHVLLEPKKGGDSLAFQGPKILDRLDKKDSWTSVSLIDHL